MSLDANWVSAVVMQNCVMTELHVQTPAEDLEIPKEFQIGADFNYAMLHEDANIWSIDARMIIHANKPAPVYTLSLRMKAHFDMREDLPTEDALEYLRTIGVGKVIDTMRGYVLSMTAQGKYGAFIVPPFTPSPASEVGSL